MYSYIIQFSYKVSENLLTQVDFWFSIQFFKEFYIKELCLDLFI